MTLDGYAEQLTQLLSAHIYQPLLPTPVSAPKSRGWGVIELHHVALLFAVGETGDEVTIRAEAQPFHETRVVRDLVTRAFHPWLARTLPAFPVTLDKQDLTVFVDGVSTRFTLYSCGNTAVAVADMGGVTLMLEGSSRTVSSVSLTPLPVDDLQAVLDGDRDSSDHDEGPCFVL